MSNTPEKNVFGPEQKLDHEALEQAGVERRAELEKIHEQREKKPGINPEQIRHEALEKAVSAEKEAKKAERQSSPAERRKGPANKRELDASYNATMDEVRTHMSAPSRAFSTVIHNKAVEKLSNAVGATVARPNAILAGAVFAFILTLAVYLLAKNLGYPLSGFETIGAFIVGWLAGILYDFLKVMITGRK
jgi:hypothetical protein